MPSRAYIGARHRTGRPGPLNAFRMPQDHSRRALPGCGPVRHAAPSGDDVDGATSAASEKSANRQIGTDTGRSLREVDGITLCGREPEPAPAREGDGDWDCGEPRAVSAH